MRLNSIKGRDYLTACAENLKGSVEILPELHVRSVALIWHGNLQS